MIFFSPYKFDALFASAADADNLSQLNYMGLRRDGSVIEAPVLTDGSGNSCRLMHIGQEKQTCSNLTVALACCTGCVLLLNSPLDASVEADLLFVERIISPCQAAPSAKKR
jgi:hypothetical protein